MSGLRTRGSTALAGLNSNVLELMSRHGTQQARKTKHKPDMSIKKKNQTRRKRSLSDVDSNSGMSGGQPPALPKDEIVRMCSSEIYASTSTESVLSCESLDSMSVNELQDTDPELDEPIQPRKKPRCEAPPAAPIQATPVLLVRTGDALPSSAAAYHTPGSQLLSKSSALTGGLALPRATPREDGEAVTDIDSSYKGNEYDTKYSMRLNRALLEREEIYLQPAGTYSSVQVEVTLADHAELVDWMAEVVYMKELQLDVLYLSVHILDSVLRLKPMKRTSFQLLGGACIFMASKLEEVQAITAETISRLAGNAFSVQDMIKMEIFVTAVLDYNVTIPTRLQFLDRILFASDLSSKEKMFAKYLIEISLHDVTFNRFRFSKVAAAAVNLARQTLRPLSDKASDIWNATLRHYSHYSDEELVDAVYALHVLHGTSDECPHLAATVAKYEAIDYLSVSRLICPRPRDLRFSSMLGGS